jgi:hypothetical protein
MISLLRLLLQDCAMSILSCSWRSPVFLHKAQRFIFLSAWYFNCICYTCLFTSLMTFLCDWKTSLKIAQEDTMKVVEHTVNIIRIHRLPWQACPPQSQNHSCIGGWKMLCSFMCKFSQFFFFLSQLCWRICYWQTALWSILWRILLLLSSSSSLVSPLCRVSTLILLRQTMSLGNTVLQLLWCNCSWCVYC